MSPERAGERKPERTRERRVTWSARLGLVLVQLLARTWRIRAYNDAPWRALLAAKTPFIFAVWHGDMLAPIWAHRHHGMVALVSEHSDGEIIARIIAKIGLESARGSSTRGGSRALLTLIRALEAGRIVAFTPDGPRGPRRVLQPGLIAAAKRAGVPVVLIGAAPSRAWRFSSWDQFALPKPFATVHLVYADPVVATEADAAADVPRFSEVMNGAVAAAESKVARG